MLDALVPLINMNEGNCSLLGDEITRHVHCLMLRLLHQFRHIVVDAHRIAPPPDVYADVMIELGELYSDGQEAELRCPRQYSELENVLKENSRFALTADQFRTPGRELRVRDPGHPIDKESLVAASR